MNTQASGQCSDPAQHPYVNPTYQTAEKKRLFICLSTYSLTLRMEVLRSSETLVNAYQTTLRHILVSCKKSSFTHQT
jgi:hypothetical protein